MFEKMKPANFNYSEYVGKDDVEQLCLGNVRILSNPLLGFDINKATTDIIKVFNQEPGSRTKAIICTVRGQGGGKTRALEEIRREFVNNHHDVLTMAITFNHHTKLESEVDFLNKYFDSPELKLSISVAIRLLYSYFRIKDKYKKVLKKR